MNVEEGLARNIVDIHGETGAEWVSRVPSLLAEIGKRWSLTFSAPFPNLSYNYVAPVTLPDGAHAVLKLGVPDRERLAEFAALPHYGPAMVRVLASDATLGALLLERLEPGEPLSSLTESGRDDDATIIAAHVMRALWQPAPVGLTVPTVSAWATGFAKLRERYDGGTGPLPLDFVEQAERDFAELIAAEPAVLLHGDLHHGNVLSAGRSPWIAIDPKGLVGQRGYDAGNFLRSYVETLANPARALKRRMDILSDELGMERETLRRWAIAQAVLSAWWSIEDHGDGWQGAIEVARVLAGMGG
ncbi:MAG TPA: aminoglycoside phosphotransferase family protein [Armatimonadota bacterium]|jgi:streptomycin 6-kinase